MMAERLQNPTVDISFNQSDENAEIKVDELLLDSVPEEEPIVVLIEPKLEVQPSMDESVENGEDKSLKQFVCSFCPFACSQLIRLKRHENKHLVKADHQCPNCSFSCRSTEILAQHLRLHNTAKASTETTVGSKAETVAESREDEGSTSGRRNELLKCVDCPYKSKHGCDMKAHIKMHQEKRTYACSQCTYSSMRFNALKSHELLHVDMQYIKTEHQNRDNSSTPKLQSMARQRKLKLIRCARSKRILGSKFERGGNEDTFYRCRYCLLEMRFCSDLWAHSRHHFMEPEAKHNCNICGFKTNLESRMEEHYLGHKAINHQESLT
uniref:C2H2-type domain-containing protein n=1 Tax=Ditylenchus dipsaci TaxID=166011 RepID=A0A915D140_9BILA